MSTPRKRHRIQVPVLEFALLDTAPFYGAIPVRVSASRRLLDLKGVVEAASASHATARRAVTLWKQRHIKNNVMSAIPVGPHDEERVHWRKSDAGFRIRTRAHRCLAPLGGALAASAGGRKTRLGASCYRALSEVSTKPGALEELLAGGAPQTRAGVCRRVARSLLAVAGLPNKVHRLPVS